MNFRNDINGLRAIAVLLVIFFHLNFRFFDGGFVGVDIFFVISGYLITSHILKQLQNNSFTLKNFYEKRFKRILPALITISSITLIISIIVLPPFLNKTVAQTLLALALFSSNIFLSRSVSYFDQDEQLNPLIHTWSLGVEEQYYLFFPLLMIAFWKINHRIKWIIQLIIISLISYYLSVLYNSKTSGFFYLLPSRAWEFVIGSLAVFSEETFFSIKKLKWLRGYFQYIGLILILISVLQLNRLSIYPNIYSLLPTVGAFLIITNNDENSILSRILSSKFFNITGLVSYSLYLWHQPLEIFSKFLLDYRYYFFSTKVIILLLAYLLSFLTYKFVESPFRKSNSIVENKVFTLSILSLFVMVCIAGLDLSYANNKIIPKSLSEWDKHVRANKCLIDSKNTNDFADECLSFGDKNILIWGDSHAASLYPGLENIQTTNNIKISQLTESACPPILNVTENLFTKNCNLINQKVLKVISQRKFDLIIMHAAWIHPDYMYSYPKLFFDLNDTINLVKSLSPKSKILIISNVPRWFVSPQNAYIHQKLRYEAKGKNEYTLFAYANVLYKIDEGFKEIAKSNDISFISPSDLLCEKNMNHSDLRSCPLIYGNRLNSNLIFYYHDWGHLSYAGSVLLDSMIIPKIMFLINKNQ